jgi:Ca2+-binding EF-hand superfamily protein
MPTTRAEVAQKVQQHFAKVDSNHDGFVTKEEAEAAASVRHDRISGRMEKRGSQMFERFDSNKDGTVTKAEADAVFATKSVDIVHAGPGDRKPKHNWDALSARFDSNKDGAISKAEFDSAHAMRVEHVADRRSHRGMGGAMFTMADANQDGKVTLAEATAAATAHFDRMDANRDGTITPDEMRAARKSMHSKPAAS